MKFVGGALAFGIAVLALSHWHLSRQIKAIPRPAAGQLEARIDDARQRAATVQAYLERDLAPRIDATRQAVANLSAQLERQTEPRIDAARQVVETLRLYMERNTSPRMEHIEQALNRLEKMLSGPTSNRLDEVRRQLHQIREQVSIITRSPVFHEHGLARLTVIRNQLRQTPGAIVVLGDSRIESAALPGFQCGHPVVNAGVGGASLSYLAERAQALLFGSGAHTILIAAGVNDAIRSEAGSEGKDGVFRAELIELINTVRGLPARVVLSTIIPVAERATLGPESFDPDLIDQFSAIIIDLAGRGGLPLVIPELGPEPWSSDGIHLKTESYRALIPALMAGACSGTTAGRQP